MITITIHRSFCALAFAFCAACAAPHVQESPQATIAPSSVASPSPALQPTPRASPPHSNTVERGSREPSPAAWLGAESVASNGGAYRVFWRHGSAPIPRGDPFSIDAWVFAANDPNTPLENVALDVDAAMPAHGHGMNRVAKITRLSGGQFRAEGLLFHMPGRWELYFDVTHGALTERAQVSVELE